MKAIRWLILPILLFLAAVALYACIAGGQFSGITFSEESAGYVGLYLEGDSITVSDDSAVLVDGTTATIVKGGDYELSGALEDGQIIVDADPADEVTLTLNDVTIHCEHSAAIWVKNAEKVKLKLPEDTLNYLSDGEFYTFSSESPEKPNACIYASSDITIKGTGTLTVDAAFRNGISSSDDLKIKSGIVTVSAPHHALRGHDSIQIMDGSVSLTGGDHAAKTSGFVAVSGGNTVMNAAKSAIHARTAVTIEPAAQVTVSGYSGPMITCIGTIQADNISDTSTQKDTLF